MKVNNAIADEIEKVLHDMMSAYKDRDIEALMACFSPDDDVSLIGTNVDEKRVGPREIRLQAEKDWNDTEYAEIAVTNKQISCAGPVAWVIADGEFNLRVGGQAMSMPARISCVLENRGGRWLIQHAHFSSPAT